MFLLQVWKESAGSSRRDAGLSLTEVMLAAALAVVVSGVLSSVVLNSTSAVSYLVADGSTVQDTLRFWDRLRNVCLQSATARITVDKTDPDADVLTLQIAGPYSGTVVWGAPDATGLWIADWSLRYRVVAGDLIEESLDSTGSPQGPPRLLVRRIDELWNGSKGFDVQISGRLLTVNLRVHKTFSDGNDYRREVSASFAIGSES